VVCGTLLPALDYNSERKEVSIDIYANDVSNLFGLAFEINYPIQELELISIVQGNLFSQDALFYYNNNEAGKACIGISQKAGHLSVADNGLVAKAIFRLNSIVTSVSGTDCKIENLQANDANGKPIMLSSQVCADLNLSEQPTLTLSNDFKLFTNYPNPFNPTTTITYSLHKASHVRVQIFDLTGRLVNTLIDTEQEAGIIQSVKWNARDEMGNEVANGMYICRMTAGDMVQHQKMILTK
jgi:flagellar hook assembly protein FlgD